LNQRLLLTECGLAGQGETYIQSSTDALMPSPQVAVHDSGTPSDSEQLKPHSTLHVLEHPSSFKVCPSSHSSDPTLIPSPQIVLHLSRPVAWLMVSQVQPLSMVQVAEQPSKESEFSSSQLSEPTRIPSPHTVEHESDSDANTPYQPIMQMQSSKRELPCSEAECPGLRVYRKTQHCMNIW
jgi:hypothetical protein